MPTFHPRPSRFRTQLYFAFASVLAACGGGSTARESPDSSSGSAGNAVVGAGSGAVAAGGAGAAGSPSTGTAGTTAGTSGSSGIGAAGESAGDAGGATEPRPLPASCADAVAAYSVATSALDASLVPADADRSWAGNTPRTPVAVDPETGVAYVGFTRAEGVSRSVVIAAEASTAQPAITIADAAIGGIAVTSDGLAALLFDPNTNIDARLWAAVARFTFDGTQTFRTDLFRSPNLDDVDTKGAPSSARLGYVAQTDQLVAYFGHTQRYDDGVRHQGGYLATLSAGGMQDVISGWFGSHNLDQRLLVDGARVAVLGLGDAFPKGIFFSYTEQARTKVIYRLAADGVGTTNGQLGGMVDLGDAIVTPFITNRSVAQDLDAGAWPNTDDAISMQIRDAAEAGTDLGLLAVPKTELPDGDLAPIWLDAAVASGARLGSLKAVQYGTGELILLAWAETTGDRRDASSAHYTMVVDRAGTVCQPKAPLDASHAFTQGDDLVRRPDGSLVWANVYGGRVQIVTLTP